MHSGRKLAGNDKTYTYAGSWGPVLVFMDQGSLSSCAIECWEAKDASYICWRVGCVYRDGHGERRVEQREVSKVKNETSVEAQGTATGVLSRKRKGQTPRN